MKHKDVVKDLKNKIAEKEKSIEKKNESYEPKKSDRFSKLKEKLGK